MAKTKTYKWDLSICEYEVFCDKEFMDKNRIRQECNCIKKQTCLAIADLLINHKKSQAEDLLLQTNKC